jgi:Inner membrane component of T3SS, cytoplasmic domain/Inner membrane component of T3SS, periplasmic domain
LEQGFVDAGAPQESDVPYRHQRKRNDRRRRDARGLMVGLKRGWRRARIRVDAVWNVATSALGIAVFKRATLKNAALSTAAISLLRRVGRRARRRVGRAWNISVSAQKSVAWRMAAGLRRSRRRVRQSARFAVHRSIPLARFVAQTARLRARRAVRAVRKRAAGSASALRRGARTATTGLGRGRRASQALDGVAFEVVSGLHGGVRLMLESGEYGIGSTPEADIILRDSGVMPGHAILGVQRGRVRLEATGGDVGVGKQVISQGHGCLLRLPFELSLGGARMRLSRIETPAVGRSRFALAGLAACSAVAIVFTIGFLREEVRARPNRLAAYLPSFEPRAGVAGPGHEDGSADANIGNAPAQPVPLIAEATHELADRINAANLQTLRVGVVDRRLAVSGALSPQDMPAWSAIQQWFDQAYRGRLVLTTNIGFGEGRAMPMLQLRAVWFGERPYIITAEGAHFNQGAILDNGWVIQDIGQDRIVLSKKAETVALTYR